VKKLAIIKREKNKKILFTPTFEIKIPVVSAEVIFTMEDNIVLNYSFP